MHLSQSLLNGSNSITVSNNTIDTTGAPSQGISLAGTYDDLTMLAFRYLGNNES